MSFHVPFNQRPSGRNSLPGPIYIGFEVPAERPRSSRFNWWGFHGLWMSFGSLLTAGFLSPIPLLISLIGLRRPGRVMASIGTVVSLLGTLLATSISWNVYQQAQVFAEQRQKAEVAALNRENVNKTNVLLGLASAEIEQYQQEHEGEFPSDMDGNLLVIKYVDPWGESLRFDRERDHSSIRSAGPDGHFYTDDDVTLRLNDSAGGSD